MIAEHVLRSPRFRFESILMVFNRTLQQRDYAALEGMHRGANLQRDQLDRW